MSERASIFCGILGNLLTVPLLLQFFVWLISSMFTGKGFLFLYNH